MMRSLFSGVSGLTSHQTRMDVIGNNIANVNTVAYKSSSVSFSEVFYQTTQVASGPNADTGKGGQNAKQIGLGTSVGSISTKVDSEGASQRTDNPFDVKLSGSGNSFFIVRSNGNTFFTRAGDFTVDANGALVTQSGANVMGWVTNDEGAVVRDVVQPLYVKSAEFTYTMPEQTTNLKVSGNVNSSSDNFKTDSDGNQKGETITLSFYDNLGYRYQASIALKQDDTYNYTTEVTAVTKEGKPADLQVSFDHDIAFNPTTGLLDGTDSVLELSITGGADADSFLVDTINVDISGLKSIGDETSFEYVDVPGAGKAVGKMSSVGIQDDGRIVASYSNGDTMVIGQIATQSFSNAAGLEKVGTNMYAATLNSGEFDGVGEEIGDAGGKMVSGTIEMSNVDLASEFTDMITTQRGFQANSRIITVSDTMLEELINLKR
ncbi:MAG: flagellar hook protein FlgE [Bacteroides sp.]